MYLEPSLLLFEGLKLINLALISVNRALIRVAFVTSILAIICWLDNLNEFLHPYLLATLKR